MRMFSLGQKNNILIKKKKRVAESVARQDRPYTRSKNHNFKNEA